MTETSDRLMTVDDVAERLGIPKSTLYGWRYRGIGPRSMRIGRWVRYDPADLESWISNRRAVGGTEDD